MARCGFLVACCLACHRSTVIAQEPVKLLNRWETTPSLPGSWMVDEPPPNTDINLDRLAAESLEVALTESRQVIRSPDDAEPAQREQALQIVMQRLTNDSLPVLAQRVFVSAAIKLSDGSEATQLWAMAEANSALQPTVERALIDWQSPLARDTWLKRIQSANRPSPALMRALEGIAACGRRASQSAGTSGLTAEKLGLAAERDAVADLLLRSGFPTATRLAAARCLGVISQSDEVDFLSRALRSESLAQEAPLLAALALRNDPSPTALRVQTRILTRSNSSNPLLQPAQRIAYVAVAKLKQSIARRLAPQLLSHPDSSLREQAVQVLNQFDDPDSLQIQGQALADINPQVRRRVRENLVSKAKIADLRPVVDQVLAEHFSADVPSGLEQAIVTAVILNDEQWCDRLVQLLDHPDPDVHIRAGWALQQLADSPGTLAAMLKHAQLWTERLVEPNPELPVRPVDIIRMAFVFQAFGHNQYQPAEELLRIYVPKQSQKMKPVTRTAAIWSLGRILEGSKNRKLSDRLAQRMLDNNPFEPEDRTVKYVSAIAIGYIGEENLIGRLQQGMQISSIEEDADQATKLDYACDWAIKRLQNPVPNNQ